MEKQSKTGQHLKKENCAKNFANISPEELREISIRGAKASAESKKRKKNMKQAADLLLSLKVKDPKIIQKMTQAGIKKGDMNNQMALMLSMLFKALQGSTNAANFFMDVLDERPKQTNAINQNSLPQEDDPMTVSIKEMLGIETRGNEDNE